MPTNPPARGKSIIGAQINQDLVRTIDERAERLGWSRSKVIEKILEEWSQTKRPLSEADRLLTEWESRSRS
jgi:metal-responsive CopG/Arc/MetJ family transcriptional regulator